MASKSMSKTPHLLDSPDHGQARPAHGQANLWLTQPMGSQTMGQPSAWPDLPMSNSTHGQASQGQARSTHCLNSTSTTANGQPIANSPLQEQPMDSPVKDNLNT
jgi:hypothetical protein